jgi:methylated-DNA-[protein]-cysteine S-methyltransferase
MSEFQDKVLKVVRSIPSGQTASYKEVARQAGYPKAYRAVGSVLGKNYDPGIPCHRVICSNGKTGHYNRGDDLKRRLLEREGFLK